MFRRTVFGIMLTMLSIGMLTSAFSIRPGKSDSAMWIMDDNDPADLLDMGDTVTMRHSVNAFFASAKQQLMPTVNPLYEHEWNAPLMDGNCAPYEVRGKWDFDSEVGRSDFPHQDYYCTELVIGLNDARQNGDSKLADLARDFGGELVNTVSMDGEINAVVVDVPREIIPSFVSEVEATGLSKYIEPNLKAEIDLAPNDPIWSDQWGPSIIEADYAWNTTFGDPSILVAVIDTGINWEHPDLAANYVPLGYDWVNNDADPMDDMGHGTHCAGIIGAVINNSIGIAGLAQVRIMAEKALDQYGRGSEDDLANAIIHAVDQGADILSNSWGLFGESLLVREAVEYAYAQGALLVAAAGNDVSEYSQSPASCWEVIAVTATNSIDEPAWFTNFGDWVELAAPGTGIRSTWMKEEYVEASGTSMSTPHVAGVAALIWSQFPNMTHNQVRVQLRSTVEDLGNPGFDQFYGYGRINARKAVEQSLPDHDLILLYQGMPSVLKPSEAATFNCTLLNFGANSESNITARLLVNDNVARYVSVNHLASGESTTISFEWTPSVEGSYNITLYVMPVDNEISTGNNVLFRHVIVRLSEVIVVPTDFSTIQKAINTVRYGYTIRVQSGTYHEHVIIDKSISLIGEGPQTTIDGDWIGIVVWLANSNNVNVTGFTIQNGELGIHLKATHNSNVSGNTIMNNVRGVALAYSGNNTLSDNNITNNEFNLGITGIYLSHFTNDIDTSNTVDGKPVHYLVNQHNLVIDPTTLPDVGYLALVNSTNITVRDLNLTGNDQGVLFAHTQNSTIQDITTSSNLWGILLIKCFWNVVYRNTIMDNLSGLDLWDSNNNTITNNSITKCFDGICLDACKNNILYDNTIVLVEYRRIFGDKRWGIVFLYSDNNTIINNEITKTHTGIYIALFSDYNKVMSNSIADNGIGSRFDYSRNNTVTENSITQNAVGIYLEASNDNLFYHNNIINNEQPVQSKGGSINKWDDGYPSGGNFWNDYAGEDLYNGPNQDEPGRDGIGDSRYIINMTNQDHYPLFNPWGLPAPEHDLAVFLEAPTVVPFGDDSLLNATVVNKGLNNETYVGLSLMIEGDIVSSTVISFLEAGSSRTIDYQWAQPVEDTWNITAYTPALPSEELTTNNIVTKMVTIYTETRIYVDPLESTVGLGQTFTVNISLSYVKDLYLWQIALYFKPAVLNCTGFSLPSNHVFAGKPFVLAYSLHAGPDYVMIGASLLGDIPGFTGSGTLLQLEFKAIGLGTSNLTFTPPANATWHADTYLVSTHTYPEDIPDVMLTDGTVEVKPILGDLNGDGEVDMRDVSIAASAFGSYAGHPRWNPIADVNKDDSVDMRDIALVARNFGETYP